MFERFTEPARMVVVHAHDEARVLGHDEIATHHLLYGLARDGDGIAARVLAARGLDAKAVSDAIVERFGRGPEAKSPGQMPFTVEAKRSLEAASDEAAALGHRFIGTEHLLLGVLARRSDGVEAVLGGVSRDELRDDVLRAMSGDSGTSR